MYIELNKIKIQRNQLKAELNFYGPGDDENRLRDALLLSVIAGGSGNVIKQFLNNDRLDDNDFAIMEKYRDRFTDLIAEMYGQLNFNTMDLEPESKTIK